MGLCSNPLLGFCESMGFQWALLNATAVNAMSESPPLVYVVVAMAARIDKLQSQTLRI
jgi:hypothetical protein